MTLPDRFEVQALLGDAALPCRRAITGEHGISLPPFIDHHVHLHLIDEHELAAGGIAGVVDLGGDPIELARRANGGIPRVAYAGAFLTVPGGYPSARPWAPDAIVREVTDPSAHPGVRGGAATSVDEQATFGASVIKVSLNAGFGPVFDAETLSAVVATARARDLPVVAHVEGDGMTRLALEAGVDVLAHTPFTERLGEALIEQAARAGQRWISTLDIHRDDVAAQRTSIANLTAFAAAGGTVLYGTDLGNGDRRVGLIAGELDALDAAGVRGAALIASLTAPWPRFDESAAVASFIPGDAPAILDEVPAWLSRAYVVPTEELIHDDH
ncbi:amidohydrolase family protein [Microbacterium deminutum]|uniref:Amidohydrolase-related domain-containing protein n=1 Tax=Microbacterium deminutum TaxID=344164 RepID=A0ABN2QMX6_9MICO